MTIGKVLVDQQEIVYALFETTAERETYILQLTKTMAHRHKRKIANSGREPVFYLDHVQSKMNRYEKI